MMFQHEMEDHILDLERRTKELEAVLREACMIFEAAKTYMPPGLKKWWDDDRVRTIDVMRNTATEVQHGYRSDVRK